MMRVAARVHWKTGGIVLLILITAETPVSVTAGQQRHTTEPNVIFLFT